MYNRNESIILEVYCKDPVQMIDYYATVEFPPSVISDTYNSRSFELQLQSVTGSQSVNCRLMFQWDSLALSSFTFTTLEINRIGLEKDLKDVLHQLPLMCPEALFASEARCQYNDHIFHTKSGLSAFTWRVVHSANPPLSVIEIFDNDGKIVATSHTLASYSLPEKKQLYNKIWSQNYFYEKSMLIRGVSGNWGLLKARWNDFQVSTASQKNNYGKLELDLFTLNGNKSRIETISNLDNNIFEWMTPPR